MKKKLFIPLLLALLLLMPLCVYAEETRPIESTPVESAPIESTPIESAPVESAPIESAPIESAPVTETPKEESETVSETIAAFIERNTDKILGILTFISSLLVAFLYKTGLLPLLRNGISAISDTAGKTGKMAEEFTEKAKEALARIEESTAPAAATLQKTEEYLKTLSDALADAKLTGEETKDILAAETALFYELLCSVNLPEEQKDSMRKAYYRLRERLGQRL